MSTLSIVMGIVVFAILFGGLAYGIVKITKE